MTQICTNMNWMLLKINLRLNWELWPMFIPVNLPLEDGGLDEGEIYWRDTYQWLSNRGYQFRPRYSPDWIPSWVGTTKNFRKCEDGVHLAVSSLHFIRHGHWIEVIQNTLICGAIHISTGAEKCQQVGPTSWGWYYAISVLWTSLIGSTQPLCSTIGSPRSTRGQWPGSSHAVAPSFQFSGIRYI